MELCTPSEQYKSGNTVNFKYSVGDIGIYPKIFHQHLEVFLLLKGTVEYVSENGRYVIKPNTLVLIPPGVYHRFCVTGDLSEYTRCVLEISPRAPFWEHFRSLTQPPTIYPLSKNSASPDCFIRLRSYSLADYGTDYAWLSEALAVEILSLLRKESSIPLSALTTPTHLSVSAMEYIHAHLDQPLSLQIIADACFVASSTLSHVFRKNYGISVIHYIQTKKMALARQYILSGKSPGEVCLLCGYTEYSTFYRAYIKEFGTPPISDKKQAESTD